MRDNLSSGALTETTLLVLLALYEKMHGYGVKLWIEEKTNGDVSLGMGTLYGTINNLLKKGWIKEHSKDKRRVFYIITDLGKNMVLEENKRLQNLISLLNEISGGTKNV
ncbi:MAG: PadR family transcriptional regulator [Clostridiales bacterium]|nr:MAG: PadR family transcriptional regulator [Clostridiales bacterium]